jgi:ComF family protein
MAALLFDYMRNNQIAGDVLVPVPLHNRRLRQRGFNQSALIANELSKLTTLPKVETCLSRLKNSPPQARTATANERRRNVADAFACVDERLNGKRVLLIDDVCTSGATLEACAAALKLAGALSVWGLTLARET